MLLPLNLEFLLSLFQSFGTQHLPAAGSGSGMGWSPLAPMVLSVSTSLDQNWNFIIWNLCCACLVSVGFALSLGFFFNQWIPVTVNFASCSRLCWVWRDCGITGMSIPWSGALTFWTRGRINHTLRCWGVIFKHEPRENYSSYWNLLTTFPGALSTPPWLFLFFCLFFCPYGKSVPGIAAGIFHPTHPYSGFSGCHFATRVAPLCLRPCKIFIFLSSSFSIILNSCWLCLSP